MCLAMSFRIAVHGPKFTFTKPGRKVARRTNLLWLPWIDHLRLQWSIQNELMSKTARQAVFRSLLQLLFLLQSQFYISQSPKDRTFFWKQNVYYPWFAHKLMCCPVHRLNKRGTLAEHDKHNDLALHEACVTREFQDLWQVPNRISEGR